MTRIFLALILTLSFFSSISNPSFASAVQSDTESAVNVAFSKVFECFDASLAKYTEGPLLPKPVGTDPIDLWMGLADALNKSASYNAHSPNWAEFAKRLVLMAQHGIKTEQQKTEYETYFQNEIEEFFAAGKTDYEWFVLFAQRLTVLMTNPDERKGYCSNNTRYDEYIRDVCAYTCNGIPVWLTHEGFSAAYKAAWSKFTREMLSLPEMLRQSGNDIIFLPYPYDMDAIDIMRTIPTPNGSHLWPVGYASDKVMADTVLLNPMKFFQHDILHANMIILSLRGAFEFDLTGAKYCMLPIELHWFTVKRNRTIFFSIVESIQHMMAVAVDKEALSTVAFFGFQHTHERFLDRVVLWHTLLTGNMRYTMHDWQWVCDPNVYQPLLPKHLLDYSKKIPFAVFSDSRSNGLDLNLETFKEQYLTCEKNFSQQLINYLYEAKREVIEAIQNFSKFFCASCEGRECPKPHSPGYENFVKFGYEYKEREVAEGSPDANYGQRTYLGSPFYLGDEPPLARVAYRSGLVDISGNE